MTLGLVTPLEVLASRPFGCAGAGSLSDSVDVFGVIFSGLCGVISRASAHAAHEVLNTDNIALRAAPLREFRGVADFWIVALRARTVHVH